MRGQKGVVDVWWGGCARGRRGGIGTRRGRPGPAEAAARFRLPGPRRAAAPAADRGVGQRLRGRNGERLDGRPAGERPRRCLGPLVGRASGDGSRRAVLARGTRLVGRRPDAFRHPRRRRVSLRRPVQHGADRLALEERRVCRRAVGRRSASPAHRAARRSRGAGRGPAGGCSLAARRAGVGPQLLGGLLLRRARVAGHPQDADGAHCLGLGRVCRRGLDGRERPARGRRVRRSSRPAAPVPCGRDRRQPAHGSPLGRLVAHARQGGHRALAARDPPARASGPTCPSP